ncbi:hypothetical protein [Mycobacteroides immunogenum]|nr:hypothetical protein [Mycobacteroides immunogenum]MCV7303955.1 hypothetical protein [Mycobacteroides immunogenum]WJR32948.1 hypothetical protein P3F83_21000 [Mycobacteroides immunogenum]
MPVSLPPAAPSVAPAERTDMAFLPVVPRWFHGKPGRIVAATVFGP